MADGPYIAEVATVIGDPARANMLTALMDGRALTATELALIAGITPQTASAHLAKLTASRLVTMERQGRHRYFRLANRAVADALEALMVLSQAAAPRHRPPGPRDHAMRHARTCYDHLAGTLGVAVSEALLERGWLTEDADDFVPTAKGRAAFAKLGIDLAAIGPSRRALARRCLDWSERRPHLGGALGAALLDRMMARGWLARTEVPRVIAVTAAGRRALPAILGVRPGCLSSAR